MANNVQLNPSRRDGSSQHEAVEGGSLSSTELGVCTHGTICLRDLP